MKPNTQRRQWCLGVLAGGAALLCGAAPVPKPKVIKVTAKKFIYTPSTITVKKGTPLVLEMTALDFVHGFRIPDLGIRLDLVPGKVLRVPIPTDKAGTFDFLCDNFCGSGHEEMNGSLSVTD